MKTLKNNLAYLAKTIISKLIFLISTTNGLKLMLKRLQIHICCDSHFCFACFNFYKPLDKHLNNVIVKRLQIHICCDSHFCFACFNFYKPLDKHLNNVIATHMYIYIYTHIYICIPTYIFEYVYIYFLICALIYTNSTTCVHGFFICIDTYSILISICSFTVKFTNISHTYVKCDCV